MKAKYIIAGIAGLVVLFAIRARAAGGAILGGLNVRDISGSLPKKGAWKTRPLSGVTDITLHHAASSNTATAEDFAKYHISGKGWPGIGYHYVIDRAGNVFQTNPLSALSYHNGYNNTKAVGISLVGNMDKEPMSEAQRQALLLLVPQIKRQIPSIYRFVGHKEYKNATACPGRFVDMNELRRRVGLAGFVGTNFRTFIGPDDEQADN